MSSIFPQNFAKNCENLLIIYWLYSGDNAVMPFVISLLWNWQTKITFIQCEPNGLQHQSLCQHGHYTSLTSSGKTSSFLGIFLIMIIYWKGTQQTRQKVCKKTSSSWLKVWLMWVWFCPLNAVWKVGNYAYHSNLMFIGTHNWKKYI